MCIAQSVKEVWGNSKEFAISNGEGVHLGYLTVDLNQVSMLVVRFGKSQHEKFSVSFSSDSISFVGEKAAHSFVVPRPMQVNISFKTKSPSQIFSFIIEDLTANIFGNPLKAESHTSYTNFNCKLFSKTWNKAHKAAILAYHNGRDTLDFMVERVIGHYITCLMVNFKVSSVVPKFIVKEVQDFIETTQLQSYPEHVFMHRESIRLRVGGRSNLSFNFELKSDGIYYRTHGHKTNNLVQQHDIIKNLIFS